MDVVELSKSFDDQIHVELTVEGERIWLNQYQLAELFKGSRTNIVEHIKNIYKSGELNEKATCSILEQVAADGKKGKMNLYNLDVINLAGYRVNSSSATQFRIWATQRLKDYLVELKISA